MMPGQQGARQQSLPLGLGKDERIPATSLFPELPNSGSWRGSQPGRMSSGAVSQMVELHFACFILMYFVLDESP